MPIKTSDGWKWGNIERSTKKDLVRTVYGIWLKNGSKGSFSEFWGHKKKPDLEDLTENKIFSDGEFDLTSFDPHPTLCPDFWNPETLELDPEIRTQLLEIAKTFYESIDFSDIFPEKQELPKKSDFFSDVIFVGSLASYNYSEYSDVDLHLVVDLSIYNFSDLEKKLLTKYFWFLKNEWNKKFSGLSIKGYSVEVYVQEKSEQNASNGVFSLLENKWIKTPDPMVGDFDRSYVVSVARSYIDKIDDLEKFLGQNPSPKSLEQFIKYCEDLKNEIIALRRNAFKDSNDEFSDGNIIFKILRRTEHIKKLSDLIDQAKLVKLSRIKEWLTEGLDLHPDVIEKLFQEINKNKTVQENCICLIDSLRSTLGFRVDPVIKALTRSKTIKNIDSGNLGKSIVFFFKSNKKAKTNFRSLDIDFKDLTKTALGKISREVSDKLGDFDQFEEFPIKINNTDFIMILCFPNNW